jgi:signal transduction histidine kinase
MTRMIEQILDLTRSRLTGIEINVAPTNLCETLTAIVDELQPAHPERMVRLRCPPLIGTWDGDRLEQVFSNLIGNALVHGDEEDVTVVARAEGRTAVVDVHNGGPPIPAHVQSTLFYPFRRGDRESRTSKTAGLGLGLYISYEIVVAHGGTIEIRSAFGEGTTFRVTLPGLGAVDSRTAVEP